MPKLSGPVKMPAPLDARELKARVDLAAFASQYTRLRRLHNRQFLGLCPVHRERHPSFYVHPERGWWCFGCDRGGDVFRLVMELRGCDFPSAVRIVAEFLGTQQRFLAPSDRGPEGAEGAQTAKRAAVYSGVRKLDEPRPRSFSPANRWPSVEECAAERASFTCQQPDNWP